MSSLYSCSIWLSSSTLVVHQAISSDLPHTELHRHSTCTELVPMQQYDVSAILLFQNDEDIIGTAVSRMARYLRERNTRFELIAINVNSTDNSAALLALIRAENPELRVLTAPNAKRAHEYGVNKARGHTVWFTTPAVLVPLLDAVSDALQQIAHDDLDLAVPHAQVIVAKRDRLARALRGLQSTARRQPRRLVSRARRLGLTVEAPTLPNTLDRRKSSWFQPLFSALSLGRTI